MIFTNMTAKIDLDEKNIASQILLERKSNRILGLKNEKELEFDDLFFWILRELEKMFEEASSYDLVQEFITATVEEVGKEGVRLTSTTGNEYTSHYVTRDVFYNIMIEMVYYFQNLIGYSGEYYSEKLGFSIKCMK